MELYHHNSINDDNSIGLGISWGHATWKILHLWLQCKSSICPSDNQPFDFMTFFWEILIKHLLWAKAFPLLFMLHTLHVSSRNHCNVFSYDAVSGWDLNQSPSWQFAIVYVSWIEFLVSEKKPIRRSSSYQAPLIQKHKNTDILLPYIIKHLWL